MLWHALDWVGDNNYHKCIMWVNLMLRELDNMSLSKGV